MTSLIHQLKDLVTRSGRKQVTPCGVNRVVYPKGWDKMSQDQRNRMVFHNLRKRWNGEYQRLTDSRGTVNEVLA